MYNSVESPLHFTARKGEKFPKSNPHSAAPQIAQRVLDGIHSMRGRSPGSGAHLCGDGGSGGEGSDGMRRLMRRMPGVIRVGVTGRAEVCGGAPVVVAVRLVLILSFLHIF